MPNRQPAQPRARRQPANRTQDAKRRWTAAERADRNRTTDSRSSEGRSSRSRTSTSRPASAARTSAGDRWENGRTYEDRRASERPASRSYDDRRSSERPANRSYDDRRSSERPANRSYDDRRSSDRHVNRSYDDRRSSERPANRSDDDRRSNDRWSKSRSSDDRRPQGSAAGRPASDRPRGGPSAAGGSPARRDRQTPRDAQAGPIASSIDPPTYVRPARDVEFAELGLPTTLVDGLAAGGITTTFPIQAATIPDALAGRDVLGRGQTGSGKTLAFGLPMLTRLAARHSGAEHQARGVVLLPTRELAMQVHDALAPLAATLNVSLTLVAGGMAYAPQLRAFERGVDIVIATPGRLLDLMERGAADLGAVEITVLDEADHMADLGFLPAVTTVLDAVPADGQRLLFSATLDRATQGLVRTYLTDPVTHEVDTGRASVTTMEHRIVHIQPKEKQLVTTEIAGRDGRTVVFVRTQLGAERVAEQLRDAGVLAGALHGGLNQSVRTRILAAFKSGELPVLVATDVAARGIHVDEVGLVLQVDPPAGSKEYLHRAGRPARAGGRGVVVTLALPQQRREVTRLVSQAGVRTEPMTAGPGDAALAAVTGAQLPNGLAISQREYDKVIAPRRPVRKPRSDRPRSDRSQSDRYGSARRGDGPGRGRNGRRGSGPRP
jgi:superfamily II DNA/RNA helicase